MIVTEAIMNMEEFINVYYAIQFLLIMNRIMILLVNGKPAPPFPNSFY